MSWDAFIEEEEKRRRQLQSDIQQSVHQGENLAIEERAKVFPTPDITGFIHSPNIQEFIFDYKKTQKEYSDLIGKETTVDEFLSIYPAYNAQAVDYATSFNISLEDFHSQTTNANFWRDKFKEEDQTVLDKRNEQIYSSNIDSYLNLTANGIEPRIGNLAFLDDKKVMNKLWGGNSMFSKKTFAKGSGLASGYRYDSDTYRLLVENEIRKTLPPELAAEIFVVPVDQATMETLGSSAPLENNYAVVNRNTGEYELLNEKGIFDNFTTFAKSMATGEMYASVATDVAIGAYTRNPWVMAGGFFLSGFGVYGGTKDYITNPMRLAGSGYEDPDKFKEWDNLRIGAFSSLIGTGSTMLMSGKNTLVRGIAGEVPENVKNVIKVLDKYKKPDGTSYKPEEILTAGNFAGFFKTLQNQSKAIAGEKGAIYEKLTEQEQIFAEIFSTILGTHKNGNPIDEILNTVSPEYISTMYALSDDLIRNDITQKAFNKSFKDSIENNQYAVVLGDNLETVYNLSMEAYKLLKKDMYDSVETTVARAIQTSEDTGYRVFFEIPAEIRTEMDSILRGLEIPQAQGITGVENVHGVYLNNKSLTKIGEEQPNFSLPQDTINVDASKVVSRSQNLPPINFNNIPDPIKNKLMALLGTEYIDSNGRLVTTGAGMSFGQDTAMVMGIFGSNNQNAFQALRGLESQITNALFDMKSGVIKSGSGTTTYSNPAAANDLVRIRDLVHKIMDMNNMKKVKSEPTVINGQVTNKNVGEIFNIGESNQKYYQDAMNLLQNAKHFTNYQERVFDKAVFNNLMRSTNLKDMPHKIWEEFSSQGYKDIQGFQANLQYFWQSLDSLNKENIAKWYQGKDIPKRVKQLVEAGMSQRNALKLEMQENFHAHLMQMSPKELDTLLTTTRNNTQLFKTMWGDQWESNLTNLRMYNTAQKNLEAQFTLHGASQQQIGRKIKELFSGGKSSSYIKIEDFMNTYNLKANPEMKKAFETQYIQTYLSDAFTKIGADTGAENLNIKLASDLISKLIKEYKPSNSVLRELISDDTYSSLVDLKFLMDTISLEGSDMGSSLIAATIAADASKIAKPKTAAYSFFQIWKYGQIGSFLTGKKSVLGKSVVQRLLDPIQQEAAQVTNLNILKANAIVPMYNAMFAAGAGSTNEEDYGMLLELLRDYTKSQLQYYKNQVVGYGR